MSLLGKIAEQRDNLGKAREEARTAENEIQRLQQSCGHKWEYCYTSIVSRRDCDMLHDWIMHLRCKKCETETIKHMSSPPCPVHMQPMKESKILEDLPPREGFRSRHIFKIQYKCELRECRETTTWDLEGGED